MSRPFPAHAWACGIVLWLAAMLWGVALGGRPPGEPPAGGVGYASPHGNNDPDDESDEEPDVRLSPVVVREKREAAASTTTEPETSWTPVPNDSAGKSDNRRAEAIAAGKGDGTAVDGYLVENVKQAGPWGDMPLQDAPYTMIVASQDFIKNQNAASTQQLFRKLPNVYQGSPDGRPGFEARGFGSTVLLDGVRLQFASVVGMPGGPADSHFSLFEMERVEVQPGLTGFLTGGGHVGGSVNYATKRPTEKRFVNITEGNLGRNQWYTHIDTGGPLADNRFGYRLNIAQINGQGAVRGTNREEYMASLALDWRVSERVLLQVNGGAYKRSHHGSKGGFGNFAGTRPQEMPDPPNPANSYGQKWEYAKSESYKWGANLYVDITDNLRFRSAYLWQQNRRRYLGTTATFSSAIPSDIDPEDYKNWLWDSIRAEASAGKAQDCGGYAYLDYDFSTFGIKHRATLGMNTSMMTAYAPRENLLYGMDANGNRDLGGASVEHPHIPPPAQWGGGIRGPEYRVHRLEYTNYVIGDEVRIGDHLIALVGFNRSLASVQRFIATGRRVARYRKYETTPNYSLVFKPWETVSLYGTYIESMEDGGTVPEREAGSNRPYTNAYEVMEPMLSKQYEVGVKTDWDGLFLAANYYWIDKTNIFDTENPDGSLTRSQNGRQKHHGFEFSVIGKATERLTLFGGLTYINAKVTDTDLADQRGARPADVPTWLAKLYAEYAVPGVEGLHVTGGVMYMGKRRVSASSTDRRSIPGFAVCDVGLRYERRLGDAETVFRLNVENVANRRYWQSTNYILGDPRTVKFSMSVQF